MGRVHDDIMRNNYSMGGTLALNYNEALVNHTNHIIVSESRWRSDRRISRTKVVRRAQPSSGNSRMVGRKTVALHAVESSDKNANEGQGGDRDCARSKRSRSIFCRQVEGHLCTKSIISIKETLGNRDFRKRRAET